MEESFGREKGIHDERPAGFLSATEDIISKLPDSLISQMLMYLPTTRDVVRTSVLSKRWKSVWLLIPGLDLNSNEFSYYNAFLSFMDSLLDFLKEHKSCLHKLKLSIHKDDDENEQSCLTRWIDSVATPKLKHLDVECLLAKRDCLQVMPVSLYICETLLYLRLHRVLLGKFESVSLPCLKTMRLELNVYVNEAGLETLISSCPALEDLSVVRRPDDNVKVLRVHSQTLTSLRIQGDDHDYEFGEFDSENLGLLIDAPRLKYLKFKNELSGSKIISTPSSLAKVSIARRFHLKDRADKVDLQKRYMVRNFFTTISGVSDMKISYDAVEFIQDIMPLPQYCNLSYLKAEFFGSPESLPTFLENFPNLKSLILVLHICFMKQISHSSVPRCLLLKWK